MSNKREVVVRPVHRDEPDLHKLAEAMIRLVLEESGRTRVIRRAAQSPATLRLPQPRTSGSDAPGLARQMRKHKRESLAGMLSHEFDRLLAGEADELNALTEQRDTTRPR